MLQTFTYIYGGIENTPEEVFSKFSWLENCEFENAVVDISKDDFLVWKDGTFITGAWENGFWQNGKWIEGNIDGIEITEAPNEKNSKNIIRIIKSEEKDVSKLGIENIKNELLYFIARHIYKNITKIEDKDVLYIKVDYDYLHDNNSLSPIYKILIKEYKDVYNLLKKSRYISIDYLILLDKEITDEESYFNKKIVSLFLNPKYKKFLTYKIFPIFNVEPMFKNKTVFVFNCYFNGNFFELENIIEHLYRTKFKKIPNNQYFKLLKKQYIRKTLRDKFRLFNLATIYFVILNEEDYDKYDFLLDFPEKEKSILILDEVAHVHKDNEYFIPSIDNLPHELFLNWEKELLKKFIKLSRVSIRSSRIIQLPEEEKVKLMMNDINENELKKEKDFFNNIFNVITDKNVHYLENKINNFTTNIS